MQAEALVNDASDLYLIESKKVISPFLEFLSVLTSIMFISFENFKFGKRFLIEYFFFFLFEKYYFFH